MAAEQAPGRAVGKLRAIGQSGDLVALFQQSELQRDLEIARRGIEQLRQLELAGVQIKPPQRIGHDLDRQDSHGDLVLLAQPLGQGRAGIGIGQAQLVSQGLSRGIEIREMVAPPLDLAPDQLHRLIGTGHPAPAAGIEQAGKGDRGLGRSAQPFGNLVAIDRQIGKAGIGQPAAQAIDPANSLILAQAARIEVIGLGQPDQQAGR